MDARDHRQIVTALDGDAYDAADAVALIVSCRNGEGFIVVLAFGEGIGLGIEVVEMVVPLTRAGVEHKIAILSLAGLYRPGDGVLGVAASREFS
ncbi:hypothetical protein SHAQ108633_03120 [Shewanella aquimarina]